VGITGPVTASYSYNGVGLRVSKAVGGTTTRFTWDVLGLPVVLSDGNEYVWGAGLIGQVTTGATATYAHADGLGSVRVLTDATGTVVGTKQYDAFGGARSTTGITLPFGYTGEQEDAESGLVYLQARYLDPSSGRFLTRDPLPGAAAAPYSQHAYAYTANSPIAWSDPLGLCRIYVGYRWIVLDGIGPFVHLAIATRQGDGPPGYNDGDTNFFEGHPERDSIADPGRLIGHGLLDQPRFPGEFEDWEQVCDDGKSSCDEANSTLDYIASATNSRDIPYSYLPGVLPSGGDLFSLLRARNSNSLVYTMLISLNIRYSDPIQIFRTYLRAPGWGRLTPQVARGYYP
jgi:RHS repeat-associated protein